MGRLTLPQGIIYLQQSDGRKRFNQEHLELLLGVAFVAAIAIEHAARVNVLETEKLLLQEGFDIRRDLIGKSPQNSMSELLPRRIETFVQLSPSVNSFPKERPQPGSTV